MIERISLRDFQGWHRLDLPLSPITVILGETNAGKSSILRALSCVLYNAMEGTAMVRNGAKLAEVELTVDGKPIKWVRGVGVNRYEAMHVTYDKPGRSVPDAVQQITQIHELEFDGEVVRVQWAPQMDAPFLLAEAGARATRMLGVAGNAAIVAQAAKLSQQESRDRVSALNAALAQLDRLREDAKQFVYLDAAAPIATQAEALDAERRALFEKRQQVIGAVVQQRELAVRQARLARRIAIAQRVARVHAHRVNLLTRRVASEAYVTLCRTQAVVRRRLAAAGRVVRLGLDRRSLLARQEIIQTYRALYVRAFNVLERRNAAMKVTILAGVRVRGFEIQQLIEQSIAMQARQLAAMHRLGEARNQALAARQRYDAILATVTCPTCGQLKSAA